MVSGANSTFNTSRRATGRQPNPWPFEPVKAIGFPKDRERLAKMEAEKEFGSQNDTSDKEVIMSFGKPATALRPNRQLTPYRKDASNEPYFFGESAKVPTKKRQKSQPRRSGRRIKPERTDVSSTLHVEKLMEINNNTEKQSAEGIARDKYYSSYSYGANNLSDRLSTGLKLDTPSPRGLARNPVGRRPARLAEPTTPIEKTKMRRQSEEDRSVFSTPSKQPILTDTSTRYVIESRRKEIRDGNVCFEETFSISFPKTLPPNVKIITSGQSFTSK